VYQSFILVPCLFPDLSDCVCKRRKLINGGVIDFTTWLKTVEASDKYVIDLNSLVVFSMEGFGKTNILQTACKRVYMI
jgi:hypothetical protein